MTVKHDVKYVIKCRNRERFRKVRNGQEQSLQQKLVDEEYNNFHIPSTQRPTLHTFREKKQYEIASFFKLVQADCCQNWLSKESGSSSTPPKRMVLNHIGTNR